MIQEVTTQHLHIIHSRYLPVLHTHPKLSFRRSSRCVAQFEKFAQYIHQGTQNTQKYNINQARKPVCIFTPYLVFSEMPVRADLDFPQPNVPIARYGFKLDANSYNFWSKAFQTQNH